MCCRASSAPAHSWRCLSDGDHGLEDGFRDMARAHPDQIAVRIGYQEPLAHRMQAGADILLAPARFEPCGLSQIYAMRYGSVPDRARDGRTGRHRRRHDTGHDQRRHGFGLRLCRTDRRWAGRRHRPGLRLLSRASGLAAPAAQQYEAGFQLDPQCRPISEPVRIRHRQRRASIRWWRCSPSRPRCRLSNRRSA